MHHGGRRENTIDYGSVDNFTIESRVPLVSQSGELPGSAGKEEPAATAERRKTRGGA